MHVNKTRVEVNIKLKYWRQPLKTQGFRLYKSKTKYEDNFVILSR